MPRIQPVAEDTPTEAVRPIFEEIKAKMGGVISNIFLTMAHSQGTLQGFLTLQDLGSKTSLGRKLQECINLFISEKNGCHYCLAAHSMIGKKFMGLSDEEIISARRGVSKDLKIQALYDFINAVIEKRGHVSDEEVIRLKSLGYSDENICDTILLIAVNTFSNYFNNITNPDIDFPEAKKL
jgi:uncharacterized peroxidase-related enzyme